MSGHLVFYIGIHVDISALGKVEVLQVLVHVFDAVIIHDACVFGKGNGSLDCITWRNVVLTAKSDGIFILRISTCISLKHKFVGDSTDKRREGLHLNHICKHAAIFERGGVATDTNLRCFVGLDLDVIDIHRGNDLTFLVCLDDAIHITIQRKVAVCGEPNLWIGQVNNHIAVFQKVGHIVDGSLTQVAQINSW